MQPEQPNWLAKLLFMKPKAELKIRIIWEVDFVKSAFVIFGTLGMIASCAG